MSRQARQRRRRHNRAGPTRILLIGGAVLFAALVIGVIATVGYVLDVARSAPRLQSLHPILKGGSSQVFAADGTRLGYIPSDQVRSPVGWYEIPDELKNATVAIEDQRFYKHKGVDPTGIFRAALKDLTTGHVVQGGSTITMQLMRNLYLGDDRRTLRQKIIEAKLALEYEKHHSKQSILTSYMNSVPYGTVGGQTAIGVQAAARIFFDKPDGQLNLQQSALLAGLPQAPSQYNPFRSAAVARHRRDEVLAKMEQLHYISPALADALSRGIDPNSTSYDSHTLEAGWLPAYPTYKVKTFDGSSAGTINLVQATLKSDNTVYAQLAADLGETTVTEMARKMGVVSPLHSYAAEALGGLEIGVTPLEM